MPTITSTPRGPAVDGVLLQWGAVLFENAPQRFKGAKDPYPNLKLGSRNAGEIRDEIRALTRCDPQVMVKILSDQKSMGEVRKVLKYVSQDYMLPLQDEQGDVYEGAAATMGLGEQFKYASCTVPEKDGKWRETFHMEAGMCRGTVDAATLQASVRAFAEAEFPGHKYAWAFHAHQEHPHVHLVVRTVNSDFKRLNPRKADLHRWRETFAAELRQRGVEARATRRATRGATKASTVQWEDKAAEQGRLRKRRGSDVALREDTMLAALTAWKHVHNALAKSDDPRDQQLARDIKAYLARTPMAQHLAESRRERQTRQAEVQPVRQEPTRPQRRSR
ncbi:relaxase/mobilization nuclease domain-containing protein [Azohydromonas australica]|uniref:relaxase/mobilization nuclease domain-containing protein n=1 Tax=Azohydromonas australica TaxID=364039 RepID=UPI0003FE3A8E|nr:relaxase/mobilization nuclease domain-containing protein [Azohydromonas australica]